MLKLRINWESVNKIFNDVELTRRITLARMETLMQNKVDITVRKRDKVLTDPNGNELICHFDSDALLSRNQTNCSICSADCLSVGIPVEVVNQDNIYFIFDIDKYGSFCSVKCIQEKLAKLKLSESARFEILGALTTLTLALDNAQPLDPIDEILVGENLYFHSSDNIFIRLPCTMPELRDNNGQNYPLGIYTHSPKMDEIISKLKCVSQ